MEVATVVGGALLSASFEKLFDLLVSPQLRQFVSKTEVESQLQKWEVMLPKIHAVLEDAQDKESKSRVVHIWLSELRDLVYDVEDVLDDFATEALRLKLKEATSSSRKVTKFLPSFGSSCVKFISGMGSKLKKITGRLETICTQKVGLDLGERAMGGGRGSSNNTTRTPTTSLPDTHFFGRETDKKAILDLLLADGAASVSVIPIQGMGGLGKTTLAQQLYNDDNVKLCFHLRAWACVSDTFDILGITKTILQSVGGGTCDGMNLDQLQVSLEKILSDKKFLIVFDDVWNEKYEDWTVLSKPFKRGAPGSKVIVTTRNGEVARLTGGATPAYRLGELSYEDCLSLFSQHALGANNFDGHPDLKDIGQKIVEKCKGLPLAAKTLGGLLRTKLQQRDEWVDILESSIWHLSEETSDILPALRLSYHHLPSKLKQCFAYCALFPKDYEFDMDELVLLWMAEGFLSHPKRSKRLEDVGVQYFNALLSRSFFQLSSKDCARYVMHDLIHDVAQAVAGEICFHLDGSVDIHEHLPTMKTRHLSFIQRLYEVSKRFEVFEEGKNLWTLLALPAHSSSAHVYVSVDLLDTVLLKLRNLRVFSIGGYKIREVPVSVNSLKHLRYLNLSQTLIKLVPDFVCSLLNLQTLLLSSCSELEKLPPGIGNLPNLCHLDIRQTTKLKEMPAGIGNLTELQSLRKFIVGLGGEGGLNIRELKNLSKLKGELSLEGLQNVEKYQDARDADLKGKEGLKQLVMKWNNLDDHVSNESVEADVLELLQPHRNLEELVIEFYCGLKFPTWFGDPILMSNVVKIELIDCWKSTSMPCLGRLPMLKHLIIKGMKEIKSLGDELYGGDSGGFLSLETLKLQDMQGLEKWCLCGNVAAVIECEWKLPNLLELEIVKCPILVGECLVSLPSLCKLKLEECNESVLRCMIDMNSLKSLDIGEMSGLSCLQESVGQLLVGLEDLKISNCEHLLSVWQSEHHQIEDNMSCLQSLEVTSCPQLVCFLTRTRMKKMASLVEMVVRGCPKISSEQGEEERNDEVELSGSLKHIELHNCGDQLVECVVNGVMLGGKGNCLVDRLEIRSCDSLQHLEIKSKRGGNKVRYLTIADCKNLVSISNSYEQESNYSIVEIEWLSVNNCPSLTSDGMKLLVAVKKLEFWDCDQLESVAEESIILYDENHNMASTVVKSIHISNCPNVKRLPDRLHQLTNLTHKRTRMKKMASLVEMVVRGCPKISSEQGEEERNDEVELSGSLKHIELHNCGDQLVECVVNGVMLGGKENCLVDFLEIRSCDSLRHLEIKSKRGGNKVRDMTIADCKNLVSISNSYEQEGSNSIVEIERLLIQNCPSLTTAGMKLLVAVKKLRLRSCSQLESVAEESIILYDENHNMTSTVVESIHISNCPNVKRLPDRLHQLINLTHLSLWSCDGLELFPETGLPLPNLISLKIIGCKNLKSVPKNIQNLTSLKCLIVQGLKSFPEEGGLPPNLMSLDIEGCPNVKPQMLEPLTSLEDLQIGGDTSITGLLLPSTVKRLLINGMKKLESISSSTSPSSSSKRLHLHDNLTSLTILQIIGCPKLRELPKEGLPPTLERLSIIGCPILQSRCVKGKGKYWPRISLIPMIYISNIRQ